MPWHFRNSTINPETITTFRTITKFGAGSLALSAVVSLMGLASPLLAADGANTPPIAGSAISKRGLSRIGIAAATIAFATLVSVVPLYPAIADNHGGDRGHDRDRRGDHGHGHRYPVYAPPSVYYPQPYSPGVSLVFPIVIH